MDLNGCPTFAIFVQSRSKTIQLAIMKLRYLSGCRSIPKSFLIPISEWNALKAKSQDTDEKKCSEIPEWHKHLLAERIEAYENGLEEVFDSEEVLKDIEKDLY